jgi:excisionase family DNA binding protein
VNGTRFLTAEGVAERFKVSIRSVYNWVDRGLLPAVRVGPRSIRFTQEDVEELLRRSDRLAQYLRLECFQDR